MFQNGDMLYGMCGKSKMWSGSIHLGTPNKIRQEHSASFVKHFLSAEAGLALCRGFRFWSDRLRILCLLRLGEPKSPGLRGEATRYDVGLQGEIRTGMWGSCFLLLRVQRESSSLAGWVL